MRLTATRACYHRHLGERHVTQDINVLALVKGNERYIFLFDDRRRSEALRTLGRYASNPELSFSWYDAAVLSQKIRDTGHDAPGYALPDHPRFHAAQPSEPGERDGLDG